MPYIGRNHRGIIKHLEPAEFSSDTKNAILNLMGAVFDGWDRLHRCNYTILHYTTLYSTTLYYACYVMLYYSMLGRCCRRWLNRVIQEHTGSDFRNRRPMVLYSPLLLLQDIACMCHFHCSNLFHYDTSSQ